MKKHISVILVLIGCNISHAQFQDGYLTETLYNDANHILSVSGGLLSAPLNFDQNDWQKTLFTIAATSALFFIDQNVKQYAQSNQSEINNDIFQIDNYLRGTTGLYAAAGLYSTGFLIKDSKIRQMGLNAIETIFLATSVTGFLKYSFGRARPYTGDNQLDFRVFRGSQEKYRAFPSGHTTGAFAFASVMAMSVDNVYWKVLWYGSASMVAAARIYHNNHWLSDTFLAGAISYSIAHYIVYYGKNDRETQSDFAVKVYPYHMGLGLQVTF